MANSYMHTNIYIFSCLNTSGYVHAIYVKDFVFNFLNKVLFSIM